MPLCLSLSLQHQSPDSKDSHANLQLRKHSSAWQLQKTRKPHRFLLLEPPSLSKTSWNSEICYLLFLHDIFGDTYRPNLKTKSNIVLWFTSLCEQHDSAVLSAQWCSAHSPSQQMEASEHWQFSTMTSAWLFSRTKLSGSRAKM